MKCNIPKDCPLYIPFLPVRTLQCNLYPVTTRQNSPMQPISCYYPLELSNAQVFVNNFLKSCCRLPKCYMHIDTDQSIDSVQQNEHYLLPGERKNNHNSVCGRAVNAATHRAQPLSTRANCLVYVAVNIC